ncbi:7-cyano-7-deazaguanine synthase QueC [bacterium]|nr:7-cyano-7-deazaguanine synthase QueC [bacterium]
MTKSIILLSGGLDSLVSLGLKKDELNVELAITFDYGQKSGLKEIESSKRICKYYNIEHKIIRLDFLNEITKTSLVSEKEIPSNIRFSQESANSVWVPNRNGLFLNIAGSIADSNNYSYILIGANKEEGETFTDNTQEFIESINNEFKYSTMVKPQVIAPLINYNKNDIVMLALKNNVPLELVMSCYQSCKGHCGICESCTRLKHALEYNHAHKYIEQIFGLQKK